jgi:hypothetical protein
MVQVGSQKYKWMFKFFSFDVLLIAKFGYISLWMITTTMATLQNSLKKHRRFLRLSGELIINLGNNLCAFFPPPPH